MNSNHLLFFIKIYSLNVTRWVISFLCLVGLSMFSTKEIHNLSIETGYVFNLYDVLFYEFGLFMYLFLIIVPIYVYLVNDIFIDNRLDTYIYIRFTDKTDIWKHKVLQLLVITLGYIFSAVFTTALIGGLSLGLPVGWSEGALNINSIMAQEEFNYINKDFLKYDPSVSLLIMLFLVFGGLFCLGMLITTITFIGKKTIVGYIVGLLSNFIILISFKFNHLLDIHLLPYHHFLLIFRGTSFRFYDTRSVYFSFFYWVILCLIITIFSRKTFLKANYIFEVKDYD